MKDAIDKMADSIGTEVQKAEIHPDLIAAIKERLANNPLLSWDQAVDLEVAKHA